MHDFKSDFPIFKDRPKLIYLDSTATSLKPQSVIDAIHGYYRNYSANVFRGIYEISEKATEEYEKSREKVARFIGTHAQQIVFVRNATEAINLVLYAWGNVYIQSGDEILGTIMEHHSNFVTWQQLAKDKQATFKLIDIDEEGKLLPVENFITKKTKLLTLTHVSNVLGTINPIKEIIATARRINPGIKILVDGAQSVPHMRINVEELGCDAYVFSGHKMVGPTGIGVLWARSEFFEEMRPFMYGGEMIKSVSVEKTEFKKAPYMFEAGTPHIAGAIGLGAAADYLSNIGMDKVRQHEIDLTDYALKLLRELRSLMIYGPKTTNIRGGVISFTLKNRDGLPIHAHDIAQIFNDQHICIRSGHHCAMPLHRRLGLGATARASFYIYNTKADIDVLIKAIEKVVETFST